MQMEDAFTHANTIHSFSPQEKTQQMSTFAPSVLSGDMARAIHNFCTEELLGACHRVSQKLERRLQPLNGIIADLQFAMKRMNVARLGELGATINDIQNQLRDLQSTVDKPDERIFARSKSGAIKEDLKVAAASARNAFNNACADLQAQMKDLGRAIQQPTAITVDHSIGGIQRQIDRIEEMVIEQGKEQEIMGKEFQDKIDHVRSTAAKTNLDLRELSDMQEGHIAGIDAVSNRLLAVEERLRDEARNVGKVDMGVLNEQKEQVFDLSLKHGRTETLVSSLYAELSRLETRHMEMDQESRTRDTNLKTEIDQVAEELAKPEHCTPSLYWSKWRLDKNLKAESKKDADILS
jgi:uncharacterized protein (DUF342 family)